MKAVEVDGACGGTEPSRKAIHQEALATTDAAPEIDTARRFGARQQAAEGVATGNLECQQFAVQALQTLGCLLCGISGIAARERCGVGIERPRSQRR